LSSILPYLDYKSTSERSEYTVGNYIGAGIDTATKALKDNEIRYVVVGAGTVVLDQVPKAGVSVQKSSSTVYLYTEKREDDYVIVPSVVGLSIKEANILLSNSGLNIRISGGLSDKCTSMTVISQDLPMLAKVKRGSVITINVLGTDFED